MAPQPRNRLLTFNDPHPMRIDRDLAAEIGLNESILFLQLEYLISISNNEREGRIWTYQSLTDLRKNYFPWWGMMTISRTIKSLEQKRLIVIGNFNKLGYDRTQWFALNEEGINSLHSVAIYQNDKWISQNGTSISHFREMDHAKMGNGSYQNDTTIPESTQRVPEITPPSSPDPKKEPKINPDRAVVMMMYAKGFQSDDAIHKVAMLGVDAETLSISIDNLRADGWKNNGGIMKRLQQSPPDPGTPYPRTKAPIAPIVRQSKEDILSPKQIAERAQKARPKHDS